MKTASNKKTATSTAAATRRPSQKRTVDILTGKEIVQVYFDPEKLIDITDTKDYDWVGKNFFTPCELVKDEGGGVTSVRLPSGEVLKQSSASKVTTNDEEGVDDILKLTDFSEMSLVHSLRVRYERDEIYTYVGPILISINPYKSIPELYSSANMMYYHQNKKDVTTAPHLFALADIAFASMMANAGSHTHHQDQSIIISGESGAGKTEATKRIMTYLARIAVMEEHQRNENNKNSGISGSCISNSTESKQQQTELQNGELEQKVLSSNPMLEAFGNAKTLRNDNSSRFGKFIKIQFNNSGRIVGATIEKYLLEKTRVIHQIEGERNYHIFHQLLNGSSKEMLSSMNLSSDKDYSFLSRDESHQMLEKEDKLNFEETRQCMTNIGIDTSMQREIFNLLAGILHLGNVHFCEDDADGQVKGVTEPTAQALQHASQLFEVPQEALLDSMTKQNMFVQGSKIVKTQSRKQAVDKRNSFAKSVYSMLFSWLVDHINASICPGVDDRVQSFIGLLDIYGFENFENMNSFEQLLINYANEKMQQHFNKHIFQIEQAEYEAEGVDWSYITFYDNQPCVDLIDGKCNGKTGIFLTLDDSMPTGKTDANANFLVTLNQTWGEKGNKHANYVLPRFSKDQRFGVLHYAGEVFYEIDDFSEKNRESTNADMKELMASSGNTVLKMMADDALQYADAKVAAGSSGASATPVRSAARKQSVTAAGGASSSSSKVNKLKEDSISKQFTTSLKQLYETLDATEPHFVRCVKPNTYKRADFLNGKEMLQQLKYAGMLEAIRIRQQGYALRLPHVQFYEKYKCLLPAVSTGKPARTLGDFVQQISEDLSVSAESWQVGTSKIFIRRDMSVKLDRLLKLRYASSAQILQKWWVGIVHSRKAIIIQSTARKFVLRKQYLRFRSATVHLQSCWRRISCVLEYHNTIERVIELQCVMRCTLARMKVKALRNPYKNMQFAELKVTLRNLNEELNHAMSCNNFNLCADIERKIEDVKQVQSTLPILEVVEPVNRKEADVYLLAIKFAMEYITENPSDDTPLFMADLIAMQEEAAAICRQFPTAIELKDALLEQQEALAVAMEKKLFKQCGSLQTSISELEAKIEVMKNAPESIELLPIEELRKRQQECEAQIATALAAKDFDACNGIQVVLDNLVTILEKRDIALETAQDMVAVAVSQMEELWNERDFMEMGYVQLRVDELQACIERQQLERMMKSTAEEEKPKLSRQELCDLISTQNNSIQAALKNKDYIACDKLNLELVELQKALDAIPSAASTKAKIEEREKYLQELINKKQFAQCPEVEAEIEALRAKHDELAKEEAENPIALSDSDENALGGVSGEQKIKVVRRRSFHGRNSLGGATSSDPAKMMINDRVVLGDRTNVDSNFKKSNGKKKGSNRRGSMMPSHLALSSSQCAVADYKPVSKLRPKAPVTAQDSLNILEVATKMASYRVDAALLLDAEGGLSGIITDNDITRRVICQSLDFSATTVQQVMTQTPKFIRSDDPALDALDMMVENRFRHLPVLNEEGGVVGLLDIAKCLYEAIAALEKVQGDGNKDAALAQVMTAAMTAKTGKNGNNQAQLMALQAMMANIFGGTVPTLRDIIGDGALPRVAPTSTIREASKVMSVVRKGVLVMEEGKDDELLGIITPKDLLNRVVAKGLNPDETLVSAVMTPNPDSVSPDLTMLDALKEMHDHKYLHLPVRESGANGKVIGMVDVMELVCSTAGGENGSSKGWRDFFSDAMNARGDDDETNSDHSNSHSKHSASAKAGNFKKPAPSKSNETAVVDCRPVSKLRPKAPITSGDSSTILEVANKMAACRVDAALLLDANGALSGIITDNDITRRVISQCIDPSGANVSTVMTQTPKCVHSDDPALDALEMMVENRFRHLPVLDKSGAVVGLLDIAKCMYEAIAALEKVQSTDDGADAALAQVMTAAMTAKTGKNGNNQAQLMAMQAMMANIFGGTVPTLRDIIGDGALPRVASTSTIREASKVMSVVRKGVLVMEEGKDDELLGIITPKDLLNRVVAKGLNPDETLVSAVMTPNPDSVSPDLTMLDALKEMHDHKYLHLPVRECDGGKVIGMVDVMELVCSTAGGENGSSKGWRDFFSDAMNARAGDNHSDTNSEHSRSKGASASNKAGGNKGDKKQQQQPTATSGTSGASSKKSSSDTRPVSKLRPKAPVTAVDSVRIIDVVERMSTHRVDAALLLDDEGGLSGIITDNDITRRVIAMFVDPSEASVDTVMTKGPKCVRSNDPALDALEMMVENRFRHLPVLNEEGAVTGLLDIAKCMYEAIAALEKVQDDGEAQQNSKDAALAQVMTAAMTAAAGGQTNKAQLAAVQAMMANVFGGAVPTLRDIIGDGALPSIRPTTNVREAAALMSKHRKGLLVLDEEQELIGIITPKDLLNRVVAKGKSPDLTAVSSVMTPNPDSVSPDLTMLDALKEMHDHKYLHLPVRESNGKVIGMVDVMELVCSTAGGENGSSKGWRDFFSDAMNARAAGDDDDATSQSNSFVSASRDASTLKKSKNGRIVKHHHRDDASDAVSARFHFDEFDFKITDVQGNIHKIRCSTESLDALKHSVAEKLSLLDNKEAPFDYKTLVLKYKDQEEDDILLNCDSSLRDACDSQRGSGGTALKLHVSGCPALDKKKAEKVGLSNIQLASGAGIVVAVVAAAAIVFMRKK